MTFFEVSLDQYCCTLDRFLNKSLSTVIGLSFMNSEEFHSKTTPARLKFFYAPALMRLICGR